MSDLILGKEYWLDGSKQQSGVFVKEREGVAFFKRGFCSDRIPSFMKYDAFEEGNTLKGKPIKTDEIGLIGIGADYPYQPVT